MKNVNLYNNKLKRVFKIQNEFESDDISLLYENGENKFIKVSILISKVKVIFKYFKQIFQFFGKKYVKIYCEKKVKMKNLLFLIHSILNYNYGDCNVNIKFYIYDKFFVRFSNKEKILYFCSKQNINKNLSIFMSSYLQKFSRQEDLNNLFYNTMNFLLAKNNICKNLKLPTFLITYDNNLFDNFQNILIDFLSLICDKLESLTFDFMYHHYGFCDDLISNGSVKFPTFIAIKLIDCICELIKITKKQFLILNINLLEIDECFIIEEILETIHQIIKQDFVSQRIIINFKVLEKFKHTDDFNLYGHSNFINKTMCKLHDFSNIYTLFFIFHKNYKNIYHKKVIKLMISKFLVINKFYEYDRTNSYYSQGQTNSKYNIENINQIPSHIKKMLKFSESNEENKLILLSNNYSL